MNANEFLSDLSQRDVQLGVLGDKLTVDAPSGILTDQDHFQLGLFKPDLLVLLVSAVRHAAGQSI